ncbi:unannotated protein [freshwater metagenome]|uniref:Unannotated protein n=1 Tax=freshwater metagenome TaxID=449393 RepID=A0A6J6JQB5_9ZZZZ
MWHEDRAELETDQVVHPPTMRHKLHSTALTQFPHLHQQPQSLAVPIRLATEHRTLDTHDRFPTAPLEVHDVIGYSEVNAKVPGEVMCARWTHQPRVGSQVARHRLRLVQHLSDHQEQGTATALLHQDQDPPTHGAGCGDVAACSTSDHALLN